MRNSLVITAHAHVLLKNKKLLMLMHYSKVLMPMLMITEQK